MESTPFGNPHGEAGFSVGPFRAVEQIGPGGMSLVCAGVHESEGYAPGTPVFTDFGVALYEMLAGHLPFGGLPPLQTIQAHVNTPVPPLPQAVPPTLRAAVYRALAKAPECRFEDAAAMRNALAGCLPAAPA